MSPIACSAGDSVDEARLHRIEGDTHSREPDPGDSRAKLVRVTPQGAVLLDRMRETASGILGRALAGLAEDDRTMLADLLGQVIANLQDRP